MFQDQRPKNSLDNVFLVLGLFYSLQRWSNGFIAERTILSKGSRGGPTFSSGSNFFKGGPDPLYPTLDPHMGDTPEIMNL